MILGTGCLGPRALHGPSVLAALSATGLRRALLVVGPAALDGSGGSHTGSGLPGGSTRGMRGDAGSSPATTGSGGSGGSGGAGGGAGSLRGVPVAGVRANWTELAAGLDVSARTRAPRLVLDLPRLFGLERACRELHALSALAPGLPWALATPEAGPLAEPGQLALLLEDRVSQRPGYWHRPARAALLGQTDVAWLDACGRHYAGASLDDVLDGKAGFPPGLGSVDFRACAELLPAGADLALDVDPLADVALLRFTCEQLRTQGFHA